MYTPSKSLAILALSLLFAAFMQAKPKNIIWIVIEDASAHISCYGETAIETVNIDQMAKEGVRFSKAFVTSPVCSPSRSAMITGMYPMTLGAHNHRSQKEKGKGMAGLPYHPSYSVPIKLVPELFREAGYYVTNKTKTDYNFISPDNLYDGSEWQAAEANQAIFAQFQLRGGKNRKAPSYVDPARVELPPYYPDDPVIRQDWAKYLDSWMQTDKEVGEILAELDAAGRLENSAVFFWTDHGVSHLRGKQYLYEEGVHVPLIVRISGEQQSGLVRDDFIEHIDIAAASLAIAGIDIPDNVQGKDFLAADHQPREYVFFGRDRCDETVDIIRGVRDERFKYIRNFMSHVSHTQPNAYKDKKEILVALRELNAQGELNELQARPFLLQRTPEELYDLENDPHETINLANDPEYCDRLVAMRELTYSRMLEVRDMGLIPEPILEDIGKEAGTKYQAFLNTDRSDQTRRLISLITAGEANDSIALMKCANSEDASTRYWAAVWLGVNQIESAKPALEDLLSDSKTSVRIAAAQALVKLGDHSHIKLIIDQLNDPNYLIGMYAIRAIEELGDVAKSYQAEIASAQDSPYEFTKRIAERLANNWK